MLSWTRESPLSADAAVRATVVAKGRVVVLKKHTCYNVVGQSDVSCLFDALCLVVSQVAVAAGIEDVVVAVAWRICQEADCRAV